MSHSRSTEEVFSDHLDLRGRGEIALEAGVITKNECAAWLEALRKEMAAGRFVSGRLHLFVWGTRSLR